MAPEQTLEELRAEIFGRLPTMADVEADRQRKREPIAKGPTRLETKTGADKDEKRDERLWRKACIKRDGKICRCCGRVVVQQLELAVNRLEVHHVAGRADRVVRWDVRNGIVLCSECHGKVTERRLFILQAARFLFHVNGLAKTYINASKKVTFSVKAAV